MTHGGVNGDYRTRPGREKRVVLLVGNGCIQDLGVAPGFLGEQCVVDHIDPDHIALGGRLAIGEAELTLVERCEPCLSLIQRLAQAGIHTDLQALWGKRGTFARVDIPGKVEAGDRVRILDTPDGPTTD